MPGTHQQKHGAHSLILATGEQEAPSFHLEHFFHSFLFSSLLFFFNLTYICIFLHFFFNAGRDLGNLGTLPKVTWPSRVRVRTNL